MGFGAIALFGSFFITLWLTEPPTPGIALTSGQFDHGVQLIPGGKIIQRFKPDHRSIQMISLSVVTFAKTPTPYTIDWKATAVSKDSRVEIGKGKIYTQDIKDWQILKLVTPVTPKFNSDEIVVEFSVPAGQTVTNLAGLVLFRPSAGEKLIPAEIDGKPSNEGLVVGLQIHYTTS